MKNLGIKGKLYFLVFASLLAFLGNIFYAGFGIVNKLSHEIDFLGKERLPLAEEVANVRTYSHAIPRYLWLAMGNDKGSEGREKALKTLEEYEIKFNKNLEVYDKFTSISGKTKEKIDELKDIDEKIDGVIKKIKNHLHATANEDVLAKKVMIDELTPFTSKMRDITKEMNELMVTRNTQMVDEAVAAASSGQRNLWISAGVVSILMLVFGFFFATSLASSLTRITDAVGSASDQVSSASQQISQGADQLSTAAQQQASSLEETSASLTEIAGMADSNVKGAESADTSAKEVYSITEETRKSMEELTTAMNSILDSNMRIVKLVKIIEEIGAKTEIIDDIVFKTQLLSFNASVEAERAGEHGRGFAVVAQEVGNLAQMSGKAATEISSIVKGSIKEAEAVAKENKERVEAGGELAHSTQEKMVTVLSKLQIVMDSISKITDASREQSQGVGQVTNAIESLNQNTQETAGTAEESASASTELTGQAQSLLGLVSELRAIVEGAGKSPLHHAKVTKLHDNKNYKQSAAA